MHGMMLKMGTSAIKTKMEERELDIDWDDYNYPPGLKIIHFKPSELVDKQKILIGHLMHVAFLCIVVFYILNLTINLIAAFGGDRDISLFMPLYSLFHLLMGVPICMGVFSKGYRAMAGISDERTWYKYGEIFILVFTGMAFCFQMLCYHGIRTVIRMQKEVGFFLFLLGVIEECILLGQWCIRLYCCIMILFKYLPVKDEEN